MRRTTLKFDQLNSLSRKDYEKYFDPMGISDDQKEDRILMAMALEDRFLEVFAFIQMRMERGEMFFTDSIPMFEAAFMAVALTRLGLTEEELQAVAMNFAEEVALTTYSNRDTPYFLSIDRAVNMAATESNAINSFGELKDAKLAGKTMKTWNVVMDGKEREWHGDINGTTVRIDEPFVVGGDLMMQPLDDTMGAGADNIANCRCWLTFM